MVSDRLPEYKAAEKLAAVIGTHLQPPWFTTAALEEVMRKLVAHRPFVRTVLDELDEDPHRLTERKVMLRQERTPDFEDAEWWGEHVHHLKREYEDALAIFERVQAADRSARQDVRGADEDDARIGRERADERKERGIAS